MSDPADKKPADQENPAPGVDEATKVEIGLAVRMALEPITAEISDLKTAMAGIQDSVAAGLKELSTMMDEKLSAISKDSEGAAGMLSSLDGRLKAVEETGAALREEMQKACNDFAKEVGDRISGLEGAAAADGEETEVNPASLDGLIQRITALEIWRRKLHLG